VAMMSNARGFIRHTSMTLRPAEQPSGHRPTRF
jgi:hypothetical protein